MMAIFLPTMSEKAAVYQLHNIIKLHTIFGQKLIILQYCKDYFGINIILLQVSNWQGYPDHFGGCIKCSYGIYFV